MRVSWEPASLTEELLTTDSIEAGIVRFCAWCFFVFNGVDPGGSTTLHWVIPYSCLYGQDKLDYVDYCSFFKNDVKSENNEEIRSRYGKS